MKSTLKWKRATAIYPTDHIISSKAREVGTWGFKPQYENVTNVNFRFLMSNEYMRLWFKERDLYQKENYSKQEKAQNESSLKRGFVQRMRTNTTLESRELPVIQLKRFQNIMSKVDTRRSTDEKAKICQRYKKTMEPVQLSRYKPNCTVKPKTMTNIDKSQKSKGKKKTPREDADSGDNQPGKCGLVCKLIN
ncbi:hypothetical protein TcasGA2_TC013539 [Tribolium castaneum]|uniref:Uncharacterized protein n=1 Tax=Tribolium castaneum TaxID=7070 RepID=D6WKZ7_TRICA|nr:hypothetical protein TcasGA2_TC013539 [Tribolium castaneum]